MYRAFFFFFLQGNTLCVVGVLWWAGAGNSNALVLIFSPDLKNCHGFSMNVYTNQLSYFYLFTYLFFQNDRRNNG